MRKRLVFKSIYFKFSFIFLSIWWVFTFLLMGFIRLIMKNVVLKNLTIFSSIVNNSIYNHIHNAEVLFYIAILITGILGTIAILIAVRGIVKPIKRISSATKEVAGGNFDVNIEERGTDEIGQLASDFNVMVKKLKNIEFLHKDFVSNVSHEFKTPITSIKGFAKLIRDNDDLSKDQIREYSGIIESESERLSLLSSKLLELSELDSNIVIEQTTEFRLDEQIRKTILILQPYWEEKEIEFDIEMEKVKVKGDEHLLQEVWINLIQNAIKFSHKKGTIDVNIITSDHMAKVSIRDYGIGISDNDKEHIFERFYKGDRSRSKDGNGLGLVLVKKIVELSKGKIYFESTEGEGSIFTVDLSL